MLELEFQCITDLIVFLLKPEVRRAIEEGSAVFENSETGEGIKGVFEYVDELVEYEAYRSVKVKDLFKVSAGRGYTAYFGVPVDSKLYSTFRMPDYMKGDYDVNWIRLWYEDGDIAISLKHNHITGTWPAPRLPGKLSEYVEEVLSTHSNAIEKLAEEVKATVLRYVLAYLAIASYTKFET